MRLRHFLFHSYFLLRRPLTMGVRAVVLNEAERKVFLVRHTYVPGWQLPGGGVERGETFNQTLIKELREEGNIELTARPELFAIYKNSHASPRDHVALFICRDFIQTAPRKPDIEIAETGFFDWENLPEETTMSTRRRLAEVLYAEVPPEHW
ncbi:NUDIX domain-containing protein [Brucellaceae bacterium C25G]